MPTASVWFMYSPCRDSARVGAWTAPRNSRGRCGCRVIGGHPSMFRRRLGVVIMCGCGCGVICRRPFVLRRRLGMVIVCGFGRCTAGSQPFVLHSPLRDIFSCSLEYLPTFYRPWSTAHLSPHPTCTRLAQIHIVCRS